MTSRTTHVVVDAMSWSDLPAIAASAPRDAVVLVSVTGAATCAVVAGLSGMWTRPIGVWLEVGPEYAASLAARDIATLSWLVDLRAVVVSSADRRSVDHARVLAALLSGEVATIDAGVARTVNAFNRPAPRAAIRIAAADGPPTRRDLALTAVAAGPGVRAWDETSSHRLE